MSNVSSFDQTAEQRFEALQIANHRRQARARFKREELATVTGRATAAALIAHHSLPAGYDFNDFREMKVAEVLLACRGVGNVKVRKVLESARVSPSKTLGGMTPRQRNAVADLLPMQSVWYSQRLAA